MDAFLKAKTMVFPRSVLVGHGTLDQLGPMARDLELDGPGLVVTGASTTRAAGERAARALAEAGIKAERLAVEGATQRSVAEVEQAVQRSHARFACAVGGGSVIDAVKLASAQAGVPFLSVPTSASHDGIASPRASIKDAQGSASVQGQAPLGILADTALIAKAPYRMLAAGCGDLVSNLCAIRDWQLAYRLRGEEFSSMAAALSLNAAEMVLENADGIRPGLEEAAWVVTKALIVSGVSMSVAGSSRPASGAEHMVSHALDRLVPGRALHGEQCGVATVIGLYLHGAAWEEVRDALHQAGAPTTAKQLGIPKDTFLEALLQAHTIRPERLTILGDGGLTREAAEQAARATGVA
jgi:glycerol-1-phosphate dehydrogenase [NAD(P)+]